MGNSYRNKDYSICEGNIVKVSQRSLQKKNVAMTSFYYLVIKIWEDIVFYLL